ncbi:MAG: Acyl-CoA N-acyltransferase [Bacteroidetes bacterium]|jgi:RimJ/RimL family protein N-acetyltransferase|nr:Acyl-CoA N-acyltransferase [Bacteroidota bacterium]
MRSYQCLHINEFSEGSYSLVSIRDEDKYAILKWRNEQIDILRQQAPLTQEQQDLYFKTTVASLFEQEQPGQLLWSFLENGKLIGYGGLVHIDWINKTGEISFLTETSRNQSKDQFISDWSTYLSILKRIAKDHLHFASIHTYAYDIRPNLYIALENSGFTETKRIKGFIEINKELKDVVIHTWYCSGLDMRFAEATDADLYFNWANDALVRQNSFQTAEIDYPTHINWFTGKLKSDDCFFYLFLNEENIPAGQVRIDRSNGEIVIGISIDAAFRGKGLGVEMLNRATENYFQKFPDAAIIAYIKEENTASLHQFTKAGFSRTENVSISGHSSYKFKKTNNERH